MICYIFKSKTKQEYRDHPIDEGKRKGIIRESTWMSTPQFFVLNITICFYLFCVPMASKCHIASPYHEAI